jgi:hypothetical protein
MPADAPNIPGSAVDVPNTSESGADADSELPNSPYAPPDAVLAAGVPNVDAAVAPDAGGPNVTASNAGVPNAGAEEAGVPNKDMLLEATLPKLGLEETNELAPPQLSRIASSAGEVPIADAAAPKLPKVPKLPSPPALPDSPIVAAAPADAPSIPTEPDVHPNTIAAIGAKLTLPVCDGVLLPNCVTNAAPLAACAAPAFSSSSSVS